MLADQLEGVPQRELNQPWRPNGARYLPEGRILQDSIHTARRPRCALKAFDIGHGRVAKVRMVPDVEEVRGKPQTLTLGDLEILDQCEVPVLLRRAAKDVAPEIAKIGGAEVRIRQALCRIELRSSGEGGGV